jgi:hypothetical protein
MSRRKQSANCRNRKRTKQTKNRCRQANRRRARHRRQAARPNKQRLLEMFQWLLPTSSIFANLKRHGNAKWVPMGLVCLAILWSWSESRNLTDAFDGALICYRSMFAYTVPCSYQGFMKALASATPRLMDLLWPVLHQRMQENRRSLLADKWLGSHRLRWLSQQHLQDCSQRGGFLCPELREWTDGQVPQEEDQGDASPQK